MISVVIPTKNSGPRLGTLLDAIRDQEVDDEVEVIVVDSASADGTPQLAIAKGTRVRGIRAEEFNHGRTRNLGANLASGEIVVFTVDDALPAGPTWLAELVAPLHGDPGIAGSYSRQVPRSDAPAGHRLYLEHRYGPEPRVQSASSVEGLTVDATRFSNVSAAYRHELLETQPFRDDLITAEDLEWCGRMLLAGHRIAYAPASVVVHSHRHTVGSWFQRYFDQGVASRHTVLRASGGSPSGVRADGLRFVRWELGRLARSRDRGDIPRTLVYEATRYAAFQAGAHSGMIPARLRPKLSCTPSYWIQQ